jgi:hypothetical protein
MKIVATALAVSALSGPAAAQSGPPAPAGVYDTANWRADFVQLKAALEASYVNLGWMGARESGVDVPALERRADALLASARTDEEARQALRGFVAGFHDGHLSELPTLTRSSAPADPEPADPVLNAGDPLTGCASLGFASTSSVSFSLPFESLPGFVLLADGLGDPFRAGLVSMGEGGPLVGVVRIQNFRARPFPAVCARVWAALSAQGRPITAEAIREAARRDWFAALAEQLKALRDKGAKIVIVDIGNNSGGDDSGDWAARLFTDRPVASARLLMVDAPVSAGYFDEQIDDLTGVLARRPGAEGRRALEEARAFFTRQKASIGRQRCDLSWVWRERRDWRQGGCRRLIEAGSAGGARASLPAHAYGDAEVEAKLSWASEVQDFQGAWTGPTYVLTNSRSNSSAEMFAAAMKDNGVARIVGVRTGGDGCGFMVETSPLVLAHSRLRFRVPNCMRLRADGADEVAGVAPDLPAPPTEGESERARAARVLRLVTADAAAARP